MHIRKCENCLFCEEEAHFFYGGPCDHAGATYETVGLAPQAGHVMHCTTCNLPETVEPHVYDAAGRRLFLMLQKEMQGKDGVDRQRLRRYHLPDRSDCDSRRYDGLHPCNEVVSALYAGLTNFGNEYTVLVTNRDKLVATESEVWGAFPGGLGERLNGIQEVRGSLTSSPPEKGIC